MCCVLNTRLVSHGYLHGARLTCVMRKLEFFFVYDFIQKYYYVMMETFFFPFFIKEILRFLNIINGNSFFLWFFYVVLHGSQMLILKNVSLDFYWNINRCYLFIWNIEQWCNWNTHFCGDQYLNSTLWALNAYTL